VKGQGKLKMRIIFKSVLMLFTKNNHNWSMLVEATFCQILTRFLRHSVVQDISVAKLKRKPD